MPDEEFVTKSDCFKITQETESKLTTVLKALVGDDLRGGIVKDVADIKTTLKKNGVGYSNNGHNGGLGRKEKALVYTALITSVGSTSGMIVVAALNYLR